MKKQCRDCKHEKDLSEFSRRYEKDGKYLSNYCKACMVLRSKAWQRKNKEAYNKYQRDYQKKIREQKNGTK